MRRRAASPFISGDIRRVSVPLATVKNVAADASLGPTPAVEAEHPGPNPGLFVPKFNQTFDNAAAASRVSRVFS
jgi:hypothetical protein